MFACFRNPVRADATPPSDYTYPRLALGTGFARDWLDKEGYGLPFLYQFGQIYTSTPPDAILAIKQAAVADGHAQWAQDVKFIYMECLQSTNTQRLKPPAFDWEVDRIRNHVVATMAAAVYYNSLEGVDWLLRDIIGDPIRTWGDDGVALNTTPSCPVGRWNGTIIYNGSEIDFGVSTVGLTFNQWMAGPLTSTVIRNSLFTQAYNGIQSEDTAGVWLYTFRGQTPDPLRDGIGMTGDELKVYGADSWPLYFTVFLKSLQPDFITRLNGHGLYYYLNGEEENNPYPYYPTGATACKLEDYGKWGGWPRAELDKWIRVYIAIEEKYHPISGQPDSPMHDAIEGWDQTALQSEPLFIWGSAKIDQWSRMTLSAALMGDGFWDGYSYGEDESFDSFLRGGMPQYAPHIIPQAGVNLGKARGGYRTYDGEPGKPLYYRRFSNEGTGYRYTVVHNPWNIVINDIPAEDGKWFYGDWPDGAFSESPRPPVAAAGDDVVIADTDGDGYVSVSMSASGSYDPDGSWISAYLWKEGDTILGTGDTPSIAFAVGIHDVTLTVTDGDSPPLSGDDTVRVTVLPQGGSPPPGGGGGGGGGRGGGGGGACFLSSGRSGLTPAGLLFAGAVFFGCIRILGFPGHGVRRRC